MNPLFKRGARRFAILLALVVILVAPWPSPWTTEIASITTNRESVRYYFRAAGLLGQITKSRPWVYAQITDKPSNHSRSLSTWADTPCHGVEQLSREIPMRAPPCDDRVFLTATR